MQHAKRAMLIGLDGADPLVVKRLAAQGRLPGLQKIAQQGVHTEGWDMLGVLPTVTPPNWATLATGNYPKAHGVTCFLNHTLGKDLGITELNWDSRRVESEFIWEAFEKAGKRSILMNYCEAWPNRVPGSQNIFVDGTGVTPFLRTSVGFQKMVYFEDGDFKITEHPHLVTQNSNDCVVYGDQIAEFAYEDKEEKEKEPFFIEETPLLEYPAAVLKGSSAEEAYQAASIDKLYSPSKQPANWQFDIPDDAKEIVIPLNEGFIRRYALLTKSNDQYDTLTVYADKKSGKALGSVTLGAWSDWIYDRFYIQEKYTSVAYKLRFVEMDNESTKGRVYISHVCNVEDFSYYYPHNIGQELLEHVGPMLYAASFERHTKLGDDIMLESWEQIADWHIEATRYLMDKYSDWGLFYMHFHAIDNINHRYINQAIPNSHPEWERHEEVIHRIYEICDKYVQALLEYADEDTLVFAVSDHGAVPRSVGYENPGIGELSGINVGVMEQLGYTVVNPVADHPGQYRIDWSKTRAINHRTSHIYINLKGRDPQGIVEPEDYEKLVQQIISDLYAYRDPKTGDRVVSFAMTREEMESVGMGGNHCGDIFFQLTKNFGFEHAHAPNDVTNQGYSLDCLCLLSGAGIAENKTITRTIRAVDVVPTICHICGIPVPQDVEGGIIYQALAE